MRVISYSELETFMRCQTKHHYKYEKTLARPFLSSGAMYLGTIYHKLQETRARQQDVGLVWMELVARETDSPVWDLMDEDQRKLALEPYDRALAMFEYWNQKYPYEDQVEVEYIEESIEVDGWSGTPDLVFWEGETLVIRDYKTTSQLPSEAPLSFQPYYYSYLMHKLWPHNDIVFEYDYISSKPPTEPTLRKDGGISRLWQINTDYETLLRFVMANKLHNNPEVRDRLNDLALNPVEFTRTFRLEWDPAMAEEVEDQLGYYREEIESGSNWRPMSIQPYGGFDSCSSCDYAPICKARLQARPINWSQYVPRDQ